MRPAPGGSLRGRSQGLGTELWWPFQQGLSWHAKWQDCRAPSTHMLPPCNEQKRSGSDGWQKSGQEMEPSAHHPGWRGSLTIQCTHVTMWENPHLHVPGVSLHECQGAGPGADAGPEFHSRAWTGSARDLGGQRPFSWGQPAALSLFLSFFPEGLYHAKINSTQSSPGTCQLLNLE